MYNIAKYLHKSGNHLTILALNTNKHFQPPEVMADVCSEIYTTNINTGIKIGKILLNFLSDVPYNAERFHSANFTKLIVQTLKNQTFDIIDLESSLLLHYFQTIRELTSAPIVLRPQNVEFVILDRLWRNEPKLHRKIYLRYLAGKMKRYESKHFLNFDGIAPLTSEDAQRIRSIGYSGKMEVVPAGVDTDFFSPNPKIIPKPNTLFYLGSLDWMPNIEALHWIMKDLYPLLRSKFPNLELHIGGKNPTTEILRYGSFQNVFIHPNLPSAPDFMRDFDIMIVPLLSGGGMRLKIVEGMAMGKTIISTSVGAEGIRYENGKDILIADSAEEFIKQIELTLNNRQLKENIGLNAQKTAHNLYSWESIIENMVDFYKTLLN